MRRPSERGRPSSDEEEEESDAVLAASAEDESGNVEVRSAAGEEAEGLGGRKVYSGRLAGSAAAAAAAATSCCHSSCFVGAVMLSVGGGAGRVGVSSNSNTVGNSVFELVLQLMLTQRLVIVDAEVEYSQLVDSALLVCTGLS